MSYKEKIKKQLDGVPRELCVAFAARSALRVLPLLAAKEKDGQAFWYWKDTDKAKHLMAVLTASRFCFGYSIIGTLDITSASDAFFAVTASSSSLANNTNSAAAFSAASAAFFAASAITTNSIASAASASDAAYTAYTDDYAGVTPTTTRQSTSSTPRSLIVILKRSLNLI